MTDLDALGNSPFDNAQRTVVVPVVSKREADPGNYDPSDDPGENTA